MFPGRGAGAGPGRLGGSGPRLPGSVPRVWNVPARNPEFTGRDQMLVALRDVLTGGDRAVVQALHGMGGVGKTQLAAEYAWRFAGAYELAWWIDAEQAGLIGDQFAALGTALDCVEPGARTEAVRAAVLGELRERDRWLLVFDNAQAPGDLAGWLPGGGHVLITSRQHRWAQVAAPVEVDVLARGESVAMLAGRVGGLAEADAGRLADALGDLPLALAQAAEYLAETGMGAAEYLALLRTRTREILDQGHPVSYPMSLAAATGLAADHPDTLYSAGILAVDLYALGEVQAARDLEQDTLDRRRRVLGADHPDTLYSASNLAVDLYALGEVQAARDLDQDTLQRRRRVLGEDHPDTLHSANNLAADLRALGEAGEGAGR